MFHYLVGVQGDFLECGSDKKLLVVEADNPHHAAFLAIVSFSQFDKKDLVWSSPRSAYAADHVHADAFYKAVSVQCVSDHNTPILKTYLDNTFKG